MRKTQMLSLAALLFFLSSFAAAQRPARRDQVAANPVPPHSFLFPYHSQEAALTFDLTQSAYYHSLNGNWKFRWYAHGDQIKPDVFRAGYSYQDWDNIPVPANWQVVGVREGRGYDNPSSGAHAPSSRPAGVYQTTFKVPPDWQGRKVFLHLAGISGQAAVWLNGRLLGHHTNDFLPVEFDLTGLVQAEKNALVVEVTSRASANPTQWRLSGIDRDAFLFSTPLFHVRHFNVGSYYHNAYPNSEDYEEAAERMRDYFFDYNQSYTNYTDTTLPLLGYRIVSAVLKEDGQKAGGVEEGDSIKVNSQRFEKGKRIDTIPHLKPKERDTSHTVCCVPQNGPVHPAKLWSKWSTEIPYLYRKGYEVRDEQYRLTEAFSFKLGIRDVRVVDEVLRMNGKPVKLKGVHYTAFDPDNGLAVPEEIMLRDIRLMKQHNITRCGFRIRTRSAGMNSVMRTACT
jgi:beta-galactosidase